ncbi:MAG: hypothetical protein IPI31_05540 [Bacteroidetes bacterium]|nr:hypothetical protein [Bacteroidota bacterium]
MNKVPLIVILLFVLNSCKTKTEDPILVAEIKTTYIVRSDNEIKHKEEYFDSLGNCIKEIYYGSNSGDTVSIVENSYAVTLLLQSIEKNRNGEIQQTTIHHYDNTNLSQKIVIRHEDTMLIQNYSYYDNGNIKREITLYPQETITPVINIRNYDIKGNPETTYDQIYEDSTMIVIGRYEMTSYINTYDTSSNRLVKVVATKLFGYYEITDTLYITSFKYDSLGNLITQNYSFNSNKDDPDSIQYEYKEKGFVLSKKSYFLDRNRSNQNSTFITLYVYDKKNRLIEEQNSDGLSYRYEYK